MDVIKRGIREETSCWAASARVVGTLGVGPGSSDRGMSMWVDQELSVQARAEVTRPSTGWHAGLRVRFIDPIPSKDAVQIGDFSQGSAVSTSSLLAREETTPAMASGPLPPFDILP